VITLALIRTGLLTAEELEPLDAVVSEPLIRDFRDLFPRLERRTFSDHNESCRHIHRAIRAEYHVKVEPLHCVTSMALEEDPPLFAYELDVITGEPVSLKYQVWLNLGKAMNLRPDCCSLKLYWAERRTLRSVLFTPDDPIAERFADVLPRLR
jgi:hypothetical protein